MAPGGFSRDPRKEEDVTDSTTISRNGTLLEAEVDGEIVALNVESASAPTTFQAGAGSDTVTISPTAQTLDGLAGQLTVQGNATDTSLAVDDGMMAEFPEQGLLPAAFAGDHDLVRGCERLAAEPRVHLAVVGNAELDVVFEKRIQHRVGNLVADLVRMPFGHGFAGEQEIAVSHCRNSPQ